MAKEKVGKKQREKSLENMTRARNELQTQAEIQHYLRLMDKYEGERKILERRPTYIA